jgi:phosphopantetheine adenylyltransferase
MSVDRGPEPGVGPETTRAIRAIVNESRVKRGLAPITFTLRESVETLDEVSISEASALVELRGKWGSRPGSEH